MSPEVSRQKSHLPTHWNRTFWLVFSTFGLAYLALVVALLVSDFQYASLSDISELLRDPRVKYSVYLSLISCTLSALLSVWIAIPTGYVLARLGRNRIENAFPESAFKRNATRLGRHLVDTLLDIPIVLPPLVVGISLLILFQTPLGQTVDSTFERLVLALGFDSIRGVVYEVPAIILAQFTVACAFAIRTMRDTFEQISERPEQIALTLGASQFQTFKEVALPQASRGCVAAFTLAWARALGEFGPILVFAGTARMKTEVLSTTVYLNFQFGNLKGALAASIILVTLAIGALLATRIIMLGDRVERRTIV